MTSRPNEHKQLRYVCRKETGGCGTVGILGEPAEELVRDVVLTALEGPGLARAIEALGDDRTGDLVGELAAAEARLEQLASDYYGDGAITRPEYNAARKRLTEAIDTIRKQLAGQSSSLAGIGSDVRGWWGSVSTDRRRAVLLAVLEYVEVAPAVKGRNRFDPDRLTFRWRV